MQIGRFKVHVHNHGFFRLDGGAMFGSVPKNLWSREAPPDEENRILLATRSLIVEDGERQILVDVGCGDKWSDKARAIFCIEDAPYQPVPGVTDVLLTHLHFDHAGGISRFAGAANEIEPCYPQAVHYVSGRNLENAKHPNVREKASYLSENVNAIAMVEHKLTGDGEELWPGITVHQSHGHTDGLQWVKISDGGQTAVYPADLCPTSKHLPLPFVMGYDMCAERALQEKSEFLQQAVQDNWIICFEHDPELAAARIRFDEKGRAVVSETVDIEAV